MNATELKLTESAVLEEAISLFDRRGGFTPDVYFSTPEFAPEGPGPLVKSACAIGGVEQAIWKLTGETIPKTVRQTLAYRRSETGKLRTKRDTYVIYARVMGRLNRISRERFSEKTGYGEVEDVEDVTQVGSRATAKKNTLGVFRTALSEISAE